MSGAEAPGPPGPARGEGAARAAMAALDRALRVGPARRRSRAVDLLGFSALRGIGSSASSMGVLLVVAAAFYGALRLVSAVGVWSFVAVAWCAMGALAWRVRDRADLSRLRLLLPKRRGGPQG